MPFVSFEGIDGSGKSTQIGLVVQWLKDQGFSVLQTKEPDGGHIGEKVREILVAKRAEPLSSLEEFLLVFAARVDHIRSVIEPALASGSWVLSDRFVDSTDALQVTAGELPRSLFNEVSKAVVQNCIPDLTIVLDLDVAEARTRTINRGGGDLDPAEATRNFEVIAMGFRNLVQRNPERCRLIDAGGSEEQVFERIEAELRTISTVGASSTPAP